MKFNEYVTQQMKVTGQTSRRAIINQIAKRAGVSFHLLSNVDRGYRISNYNKASAVAAATDFAVTVKDLCE